MPLGLADPASSIVSISALDSLRGFGLQYAGDNSGTYNVSTAPWPSNNLALAYPVYIDRPMTVTKMWWQNNGVSGNVDCGIYTKAYALVVSTGSTVDAGASTVQAVSVTASLQPGIYFVAMVCSTTGATFLRGSPQASLLRTYGMIQMAAALPLPATFVPATIGQNYLPHFGFTARTLI